MAMHANLQPNQFAPQHPFEEIQFFSNDSLYTQGVAFYNDHFPNVTGNTSQLMLLEKSSTYFDSAQAPLRMRELIPSAKILIVLRNPLSVAYDLYRVGL